MKHICAPPEGHGPAHSRICRDIRRAVQGSVKTRWQHGILVADKVSELFERLKPAPETNLLAASTISLALIHHIVDEGSEAQATENTFARIRNALAKMHKSHGLQGELRVTDEQFFSRITQYWMEYKVMVRDLDLRAGTGFAEYSAAARGGTLSLPTYLVRLIDLSIDPMEAEKGLPEGRKLSDSERDTLSTKILNIHFPVADTLGFGAVANGLRYNGVHMSRDEARRGLLRKEERWQRENRAALRNASDDLRTLVRERLRLLDGIPLMQTLGDSEGGLAIDIHPTRMKTPESCVLKLDKKDEIHDRVAVRLVFHCTPDEAHAIGRALYTRLYAPEFVELKVDDHYENPGPSGFTAFQITGKNKLHKVKQVEGHGEADGIPCEVQVIDEKSFDEAQCGRWARLRYKTEDEAAKDSTILGVFYGLLGPFLEAIKNGGLVVEPYVPRVLREKQHEAVKYSIHCEGRKEPVDVESPTPISGIDAVVAATGAAVKATIYASASETGDTFTHFDDIPKGITNISVVPTKDAVTGNNVPLAPELCRNLVPKAVLEQTRMVLHQAMNGKKNHGRHNH